MFQVNKEAILFMIIWHWTNGEESKRGNPLLVLHGLFVLISSK